MLGTSSAGVSLICLWDLEMFNYCELAAMCVPCPALELPAGFSQVPGLGAGLARAASPTTSPSSRAALRGHRHGYGLSCPGSSHPGSQAFPGGGIATYVRGDAVSGEAEVAQTVFLIRCLSRLVLPLLQPCRLLMVCLCARWLCFPSAAHFSHSPAKGFLQIPPMEAPA